MGLEVRSQISLEEARVERGRGVGVSQAERSLCADSAASEGGCVVREAVWLQAWQRWGQLKLRGGFWRPRS